jgi:hypothetical protein
VPRSPSTDMFRRSKWTCRSSALPHSAVMCLILCRKPDLSPDEQRAKPAPTQPVAVDCAL